MAALFPRQKRWKIWLFGNCWNRCTCRGVTSGSIETGMQIYKSEKIDMGKVAVSGAGAGYQNADCRLCKYEDSWE